MRRRSILALACVAALPVLAQRPPIPVVGFLNSATRELYAFNLAAFRSGLQEAGYVEGKNVAIEYRFGRGDYDRMPTLRRRPRELWSEHPRDVSTGRPLRGPHPRRHQSRRNAGASADTRRTRDQHEDRAGTGIALPRTLLLRANELIE
jgi:hypothetical protein